MTVEEIFNALANQMIEGLMIHSQLSDYYGFLGLLGYAKCHRYHYFEENRNYRAISDYYLLHYNKIIESTPIPNPSIIPTTWFSHKRTDVTPQTRKASIQAGFDKWVNWETDTKKKYEMLYQELINLDEVASALEVAKLIKDVDEELAEADQKRLEQIANDYNISDIINLQDELEQTYLTKLGELELC